MKTISTLALLAAVSGGAYAQSSVTIFGIVDEAARYVKNGDLTVKSLISGGISSSRLGFRGTEDLGGGLQAGFWLETGLNADSGTLADATRYWNRRSTVSLQGTFGELRLGRDYTPTYRGYVDYDPFGDNGVAASSKFDSSLGTTRDTGTRADNQIMYFLPGGIGGVYGTVAVAAAEGAVGKKYFGARIGYAAGPVDVSIALGQTTVAPVLGEDKFKVADVGASYDFGLVKLLGYYRQNKIANNKIATYGLGVIVPVGPGQLRAGYTHSDSSGRNAANVNVNANDASQFALGYIHNLSKRTALYGTVAHVKNKGNANFAVASAPTLVAGGKSTGVEVGIRHSF